MELIIETSRKPDRAVVVVTHDDRVFDLADRIVHMDDGRVDRIDLVGDPPKRIAPGGKSA
jgi:putative ABC transport system ATP-binding protein